MGRSVIAAAFVLAGLVSVVPVSASPLADGPSPAEATVPAGFGDVPVANVSSPTTVVGLFDGRVVVLGKAGAVRVIKGGALLPTAALSLSVCQQGERGLLGFAADPGFQVNGFVYIFYTRNTGSGCSNRVSRFTMAPGGDIISAGSELVLLDNLGAQMTASNHNGGDLEVGNDGFLYVAVGDGGCYARSPGNCQGSNPAAQDLTLLNGKILRVDRTTGEAAPGNPFSAAPGSVACRTRGNTGSTPLTGPCREIFAYGLRNPWRLAFDTNTGGTRFFINDVGQGTREEIDLGTYGANYGWPAREGRCKQGSNPGISCPPTSTDPDSRTVQYCRPNGTNICTEPLDDYAHNDSALDFLGEYITGGAFIPNGAWPSEYDGGYMFGDGNPGSVSFRSAAGDIDFHDPFSPDTGSVYDLNFVMDPDGWALYYVGSLSGGSSVRKIVSNTAPAPSPGALAYTPLATSQRAYDTRDLGADSGPMRAGSSRLVDVDPPSGSARAALVNITVVQPLAEGFVTAWQPRTTRPATSNNNAGPSTIAANASIVPIDADGMVLVYSSTTAQVVVDVLGFFSDAPSSVAAGRFAPVVPVRAVDTRNPFDATGNNFTRGSDAGPGEVVDVPLRGRHGIGANADDVSAVVLVVTALAAGGPAGGYAVAYPSGTATPSSSSVNTNGSGDVRANLVIVPIGADGSVDVRLVTVQDVLVDVVGVVTGGGSPVATAGRYVPISPVRGADTRISLGFTTPSMNTSRDLNTTQVPDDALAVANNITLTNTAGFGYVTAYPTGTTQPVVSNGNATGAGQTRAVMSVTSLGSGSSTYFVSMTTDLVVDISGYFSA